MSRSQEEPRARGSKLPACPLCGSKRLHYAFSLEGARVVRCEECRLLLLNPQPPEAGTPGPLDELENDRIFVWTWLELLRARLGAGRARVLKAGGEAGYFLAEAARAGFDAVHVSARALLEGETGPGNSGPFDACILSRAVERVGDPVGLLRQARARLKPGGLLLVTAPQLDSLPAQVLRRNWPGFNPRNLNYFDTNTMQHALYQAGFREITAHIGDLARGGAPGQHAGRAPSALGRELALRFCPRVLLSGRPEEAEGMMHVLASAAEVNDPPLLSVVVPAFNEATTFPRLMQALLAKQLPGLALEVIVVESNSTDGTRELAQGYADHPRVRLVFEDRPRGKGHAVRTGLEHAAGDFVIIQDADLEYDLEDYEPLLLPLVKFQEALVLGARHGGKEWWKMRQFTDQKILGAIVNLGHLFFTTVINVLYRLNLRDPQTMFKVFRRDCLHGLSFSCNHFDFDYELLTKLTRKGYRPLEIPVNYSSRSFKEGKKISLWKDPLRGLWALLRLRLTPRRAFYSPHGGNQEDRIHGR